jgi:hypothetical protein
MGDVLSLSWLLLSYPARTPRSPASSPLSSLKAFRTIVHARRATDCNDWPAIIVSSTKESQEGCRVKRGGTPPVDPLANGVLSLSVQFQVSSRIVSAQVAR